MVSTTENLLSSVVPQESLRQRVLSFRLRGEAGLGGTASDWGPWCVYATGLGEAAFNATVSNKAKLTKILTYHVLSGAVFAKDVATGNAPTLEGGNLRLRKVGEGVRVGHSTLTPAKVVLPDLPASNGVIHVIDKVLLPPTLDALSGGRPLGPSRPSSEGPSFPAASLDFIPSPPKPW